MASAIMRGWEHVGYNKETGTIIALARKSVIVARSIDFGVTWQDIKLPQPTFLNDMWYSGIDCDHERGVWFITTFNSKGVLVSMDDGLTWNKMSNNWRFGGTGTSGQTYGVSENTIRHNTVCYGGGRWIFGIEHGTQSKVGNSSAYNMANDIVIPLPILHSELASLMTAAAAIRAPHYKALNAGNKFSNNYLNDVQCIRYISNNNKFYGISAAHTASVSAAPECKTNGDDATCVGPRSDLAVKRQWLFDPTLAPASSITDLGNHADMPDHNTHLCYDEDEDILIGIKDRRYIVTSEDSGTSWSPSSNPALESFNPNPPTPCENADIKSMACAQGVIILTLNENTDKIYRSIDRGNTFQEITLSEPGLWTAKYCGNRFIMVAFNSNKSARSLTLDEV